MTAFGLLANLAFRFATHPENLATEALAHVLRTSADASRALARVANDLAPGCITTDITFRTQAAGEDDAIPDMVALDADGREMLLIESKFWAGLTRAQPVTYLARLGDSRGGLLLFIAPAARIETLWPELVRRCRADALNVSEEALSSENRRALVNDDRVLALISWRWLLDRLLLATVDAQDREVAADIQQLRGLCEAMDTTAFLPLHSEELTGTVGLRITQYCALVDDLAQRLIADNHATKDRLRASAGSGWYGQYLMVHGHGCLLAFSAARWAEHGVSPIWLRVAGSDWKRDPTIADALRLYMPMLPVHHSDYGTVVPIALRFGVEREAVFSDALAQLVDVACALERRSASMGFPPLPGTQPATVPLDGNGV